LVVHRLPFGYDGRAMEFADPTPGTPFRLEHRTFHKVGFLGCGRSSGFYDAFRERLRQLGYHDGRNIIFRQSVEAGAAELRTECGRAVPAGSLLGR